MKYLIILISLTGIAFAEQGKWKVVQKSPNSITFPPSGPKEKVHTVTVYFRKRLMLECTIGDNEKVGSCGHQEITIEWKANKIINWINPSTDYRR